MKRFEKGLHLAEVVDRRDIYIDAHSHIEKTLVILNDDDKELINKLFINNTSKNYTISSVARISGCSRATIHRRLKKVFTIMKTHMNKNITN